eukprot:144396-Pleurochrysis_carterae.AAC.1
MHAGLRSPQLQGCIERFKIKCMHTVLVCPVHLRLPCARACGTPVCVPHPATRVRSPAHPSPFVHAEQIKVIRPARKCVCKVARATAYLRDVSADAEREDQ